MSRTKPYRGLSISAILQVIERHGSESDWADTYGEPGYNSSAGALCDACNGTGKPLAPLSPAECADCSGSGRVFRGVILANWNRTPKYVGAYLERHGFACEWSDEWITIHRNGRTEAFRCQPDSHGWRASFLLNDWTNGEPIAADDIREDSTDYIEEYLLNNATAADCFRVDLAAHGFAKLADGENGFHPGQNDKPADMLKAAQSANPGADFVFQIDNIGQFDMHFSIWKRDTSHSDTAEESAD